MTHLLAIGTAPLSPIMNGTQFLVSCGTGATELKRMLMGIREAVRHRVLVLPICTSAGAPKHIACASGQETGQLHRSLGSLSVVFLFLSHHPWRGSQVLKGTERQSESWPKWVPLRSTPNLKSSLEPARITSDQTSGPSPRCSGCQAMKELAHQAYRLQKGNQQRPVLTLTPILEVPYC